jgi:hypothetical protein
LWLRFYYKITGQKRVQKHPLIGNSVEESGVTINPDVYKVPRLKLSQIEIGAHRPNNERKYFRPNAINGMQGIDTKLSQTP